MREKLKIPYPIICEGKYDKIKLDSVLDAYIITTEGFGIFKNEEKRHLLQKICKDTKVITVTDSDGAGGVIRSHLRSILPAESMINLYIPRVKGKEKRKTAPSAEGFLGVEGTDADIIYGMFLPYSGSMPQKRGGLTKTELYQLGFLGGEMSAVLRRRLCDRLDLPPMSANALLEALNLLYEKDESTEILIEIKGEI